MQATGAHAGWRACPLRKRGLGSGEEGVPGQGRRRKDKGGHAWHTRPVHELSEEGRRGMGYQSLDEVKGVSTQGEALWWWPGVE